MGRTKDVIIAGLLLATAIASIGAASVTERPSTTPADQSFTRYMLGSSFGVNPETSALCFGYFIPILNNITEEFSRTYQQCAVNEMAQMAGMNDKMTSNHYQLDSAAMGVCDRLNSCNEHSDPLDYFDCFERQGREASKIIYTITVNSTAIGADLREDYQLYELAKYRCQNASERAYVENTATTYYQLDICLRTGEMPSTANPITTTVATTTDTTNPSEENTTTTIAVTEPEVTSPMPPQDIEDSNGRGMKMLSKLQKYWPI